jgi:hypothetical protein
MSRCDTQADAQSHARRGAGPVRVSCFEDMHTRSLAVPLVLAVHAVGLAGCAAHPVPAVVAAAPTLDSPPVVALAAAAPRLARHVDLEFELAGRPFASPLLRAEIGGRATWLVVDTGASYHALSGWLAGDLHLESTSGTPGKDHVGRDIAMSLIERASIASVGWPMLTDAPLLVADVPDAFRHMNLGGFLAPQFLATGDDRALLDLERAELSVTSRAQAEADLVGRGGRFPIVGSRVCRSHDAPVPYRAFVLPAYVDEQPVNLLVDTGAERSNVRMGSAAGQRLLGHANGDRLHVYGAAGAFDALVLPATRVQVGEVMTTADIELVPGVENAGCPSDGVIGMDILRACILSFGATGPLEGRCGGDPPEAPDPQE